jgi:hypothetical protein
MKFTSLILVSLLFSVGCATLAPKGLPPELKPAYTANEVLVRVHELQDTVIKLYDAQPRGITKESADIIVRFTVSTATILKSSMDGWQQTVKASWSALKKQYTPTDSTMLITWNLLDVMIQSLVGVQ